MSATRSTEKSRGGGGSLSVITKHRGHHGERASKSGQAHKTGHIARVHCEVLNQAVSGGRSAAGQVMLLLRRTERRAREGPAAAVNPNA